ncbi:MAG: thioredoxin family protein [Crocinitomicaceae bacterium]|nr:MAG: thioredoxin family protein [Crocinitomicaceae bacterium]
MKTVKVLGTGCAKCKSSYDHVLEAIRITGVEASVEKIEDIEEMMRYNVLTTPVLMIDEVAVIKGRVASVAEIAELLKR